MKNHKTGPKKSSEEIHISAPKAGKIVVRKVGSINRFPLISLKHERPTKSSGWVRGKIIGRKVNESDNRFIVFNRSPHNVFVGPSVDGQEVEVVKVIGGKIDQRKPSFATKK